MNNYSEFVSFWGGVASIIALALTFIGFLVVFYKWGKKRREQEFAKLLSMRDKIARRTRDATTQGKRSDTFIYYQSILSSRRFSHALRELYVYFMHIVFVGYLYVYTQHQEDHIYIADRFFSEASKGIVYENYHWIGAINIALFFILNVFLRVLINKERRRLESMSDAFVNEIEDVVFKC